MKSIIKCNIDNNMELLGYFLAILMGCVLGLLGAGGSILTLPILVYVFKIPPTVATGYSLLIVGLTALLGSLDYFKKELINLKVTLIFAIPSLIAVYFTRFFVVPNLPDEISLFNFLHTSKETLIMHLYAFILPIASFMLFKQKDIIEENDKMKLSTAYKNILTGIEGAAVGFITGIIGAGGGFMIIPTLVLLVGLDMKTAVGSSLLIISIKSLLGFIGDIQNGISLDITFLIKFFVCTFFGMYLGINFSKKVDSTFLKKLFGLIMLSICIIIFLKEIILS